MASARKVKRNDKQSHRHSICSFRYRTVRRCAVCAALGRPLGPFNRVWQKARTRYCSILPGISDRLIESCRLEVAVVANDYRIVAKTNEELIFGKCIICDLLFCYFLKPAAVGDAKEVRPRKCD